MTSLILKIGKRLDMKELTILHWAGQYLGGRTVQGETLFHLDFKEIADVQGTDPFTVEFRKKLAKVVVLT